MTGTHQLRFRVLIGAAATALLGWLLIPGSPIDRAAFTLTVRGFANPPFFISGNGSHDTPWKLRTFTRQNRPDPRKAPVVVSLGDDPEGFFQSSPPSTIDLAVIFDNLQRLGADKTAVAAVLAWDTPDPIGLLALEKAINRFDSLIMAAPLSRGAVPESMPSPFRQASIPLSAISGDISLLPIVNRIPLAGIILGGKNTIAGFQSIDNEPENEFPQLVAVWEDRLVFAFPVLAALQHLAVPLDGVEVKPGKYIRLAPNGPVVPIDPYGRLAVRLKPGAPSVQIPAESLIGANNDFLPRQHRNSVILRDDLSASDPATRHFSRTLPALLLALTSDNALSTETSYPRIRASQEIGFLTFFIALVSAISTRSPFARNIGFLITVSACLTIQLIAAATAALWLPGIPALTAILAAFVCCLLIKAPSPRPEPEPGQPAKGIRAEPRPIPAAEPCPEPSRKTPAKQAARKSGKSRKKRAR